MKLSIITINYNNAEGLRSTIESVVNQNLSDYEYIVIDGASTDGSVDIINEYSDKINYSISELDTGIYNAMNKGFKEAHGEYLLFVNSGDVLHQDADMDMIVNGIMDEDLIYHNLEIVSPTTNEQFIKKYPQTLDFKYFVGDALPHMATFIRRERLVEYGGYSEELKYVSDWAFFIDAVCHKGWTYKYVDDCFSTFYLDGVSTQYENRQKLADERHKHIEQVYPRYNSLYKEWLDKKQEIYKLKTSKSVTLLRKLGMLKWLKD